MSRPINCPACGAHMEMRKLYSWNYEHSAYGPNVYYICSCGLQGPVYNSSSFRGAAIKAGRAMRRTVEMVDKRIRNRIVVGCNRIGCARRIMNHD